jgi:hypothetical protein
MTIAWLTGIPRRSKPLAGGDQAYCNAERPVNVRPLAKPCLGVSSAPSHEVFRVIGRHLGCGRWLNAERSQAFLARAVHLALKLGHVTRALANLFHRNASPRVNHERIVDVGAEA